MPQQLLHIYGPFSVQSFGLAISIGFYTTLRLLLIHPKRKALISTDNLVRLLSVITFGAVVGGRMLFLAINWNKAYDLYSIISFWDGGFSLLGSLIASGLCAFLFFKKNTIPILPMFDLLALHAPLMQAISRVGCFMAGCCFGYQSSIPWHTVYGGNTFAPTGIPLHPTQLYSAGALLLIFIFLYWYAQHKVTKTGQLFYLYLTMVSIERLSIDFFRGDREFLPWRWAQLFSVHQLIACILMTIASILLIKSYNSVQSTTITQK